jgi:ribosome maturation factor RimP
MGEEVEVKTYMMKEVEGLKRKQKEFTGILTNYENERVTIKTEEQVVITFDKSEISLIRLAFDF